MLTEVAYRERKWGWLPALRKALEDKKVPNEYYGFTSVSDNKFDSIVRLLEISILAHEYESDVKKTAQLVGLEEMHRDLEQLANALEATSTDIKRSAEKVRALIIQI